MAVGAAILSVAALLGLNAVLQKVPAAYIGLKIVGGIYLLYLAYKTWRGASEPIRIAEGPNFSTTGLLRHSWLAAITMLSNPKAAVQYGVIFAAMLPQSPSLALTAALPPSVFALEASWYLVVAFVLSAPRSRGAYLRSKAVIDRIAGVVLASLGLKLLLSSR
jgi:threonine/homoserine/homoserine lactone efflux protein